MDTLLENAERIFEVARSEGARVANAGFSGSGEDFALLIRPDGGLHFIMEAHFSIEAAAIHTGAQAAFRVTHLREGVRVEGRNSSQTCVLEERNPQRQLLPNQPLYRITSPLLTGCSVSS
jgi:hypothetical protein